MDHSDKPNEHVAEMRAMRMLAGAAVIVALTGPMWVPTLLGSLNWQSAESIEQARQRDQIALLTRQSAASDQRLKATEAALAKLTADVTATQQQVGKLSDALGRSAAADLATGLQLSGGFARQLTAARAAIPAGSPMSPMLDQIAPYAETGIPAMERIRARFMRAAAASGVVEAAGPMSWIRRAVFSGPAEPAGPQAEKFVAIEALLRDGDLAGAVTLARTVDDPRPEWLAGWIDEAQARVAADALVRQLNAGTK